MDNYNQDHSQNGYTDNSHPNDTNTWTQTPRQPVVADTMASKKSQLATTSLVLGILAIAFCWAFLIPLGMGLTGLVLGIISLYKTKENYGVAVAGAIVSGVGMFLNLAITVIYVFLAL